MCEHAATTKALAELLPHLCELVTDPCVNVRLELSQTVARIFDKVPNNAKLHDVVRRLKTDSSRDVTYPLRAIQLPEADAEVFEVIPTVTSKMKTAEIDEPLQKVRAYLEMIYADCCN